MSHQFVNMLERATVFKTYRSALSALARCAVAEGFGEVHNLEVKQWGGGWRASASNRYAYMLFVGKEPLNGTN